jgi:hypothetical protein
MGGGGNSGGGDQRTEVRYAKYVESKHKDFLNKIVESRDTALEISPFY